MPDSTMLATVLFTDIVGSTEIAADMGDRRWQELLRRHHAMVRQALACLNAPQGHHPNQSRGQRESSADRSSVPGK
jgi:hypothetical protein